MDLVDVGDHVCLSVENEIAKAPADESGENPGSTRPCRSAISRQSGPLSGM